MLLEQTGKDQCHLTLINMCAGSDKDDTKKHETLISMARLKQLKLQQAE